MSMSRGDCIYPITGLHFSLQPIVMQGCDHVCRDVITWVDCSIYSIVARETDRYSESDY